MNISKVITTCIVLLAFVSCTDTNGWEEGTRTPSLKASFIYFPQSQIELGGTSNLSKTVQLQAVETPWKITNPASDWLEVSPMEGSGDATVTFKAKENPTSDKVRTALLSLQSMDADYSFSHSLTVNQGRANSVLNLSDQTFELTREAQIKTVSVTANTDWKATSSEDWVHLTKQSDTSLEIKVDENNESAERTAYITISGSKSSKIKIIQSGVSVTPGQTYVEFSRESQTKTVTVSSNYKWQASCSANWISLKSSPETGKLSITVTENNGTTDRTAYIKLSGNNTTEIKVTQKGIYVTINQTNFELSRESQNLNINVSSNYSWQASCSANWIHLKSSPETGKLSITVDENNGTTDRTGKISISNCNTPINVIQHGYVFDDLISELDFDTKSSTKTLNIKTDGAWTATSNKTWIHVSPKSGNGSTQLSISVDDNEGTEIRKGTVSVTVGTVTKYVSIQQTGAYFDISTSLESEIPASGGTRTITFSTSEDWTIECTNPSWVSVDKTSGTAGVNTITLTFLKNMQETTRTDITYIRTKNKNFQDIRIITAQNGIFLYISYSSGSEIPAEGGTRSVTFSTSDEWTVDCPNSSWVSVDKNSGRAGTITLVLRFSQNSSYAGRKDITYIRTKNQDLKDLEIITNQNGVEILNNGREYVDLGLPSGTLWATMNIGATSPEDYGDYFAWGETEGDTEKTAWDGSTYKWSNGGSVYTKYNASDNKTELELADDAALQNWGGDWHMPSKEQMDELCKSCIVSERTLNGVYGRMFSNNGHSIFLPAAGIKINKGISAPYSSSGFYWSRSKSYYLFFSPKVNYSVQDYQSRCYGMPVRPVLSK